MAESKEIDLTGAFAPEGAAPEPVFPWWPRRRLTRRGPSHDFTSRPVQREPDRSDLLTSLAETQAVLARLGSEGEVAMEVAARTFKGLAGQADAILKGAGAIAACVDPQNLGDVLDAIQSLCLTVSVLLERRLAAAASILNSLKEEDRLLKQLTQITHRQEAIASHLGTLSVLTDVEVARLGSAGGDFVVLARELSSFSKAISQQTLELSHRTVSRHKAIEESGRELAATVPRLRADLNRMESGIGEQLQHIGSLLQQLSKIPGQFKTYAQKTADQITAVVAAIQSHDITRQQIEHVDTGIQIIIQEITERSERAETWPMVHAGLAVQALQLGNIQAIAANWTAQVGECMGALQRLSVSELVNIGPAVLSQERELTARLSLISSLKQKCDDYNSRVGGTLSGLSNLLEIVNEHLEKSERVRHRLQLLTFNSLIEAHRLDRRGAVVSAIAQLIREVSREWMGIADQSKLTLSEIMKLVEETGKLMEVFSETKNEKLREDEEYASAALDAVRSAAAFVASESAKMQAVTERMQGDVASAGNQSELLQACFRPLDDAMNRMQSASRAIEAQHPGIAKRWNAAEAERLFSASYTTEVERQVLLAALRGSEMPALEQVSTGNDVELF
jgi:hypothetical protein